MIWLIGFLTAILILDCLMLVLLILVQLPKKEAGLGQAFGGSTTDALFGAGSGNALTKLTKYATVIFLALTLSLSIMNAHNKTRVSTLEQNMQKLPKTAPSSLPGAPPGTATANTPENPATNVLSTNAVLQTPPAATNVPATPSASTPTAATPSPATPAPGTNTAAPPK